MGRFDLYDENTAPAESLDGIRAAKESFGFAPNLVKEFAGAPAALNAYLAVAEQFSDTSLSAGEQQLVLLATSVENRCAYCVAAHTGGALQAGLPESVVDAVRHGEAVDDDRLEALRRFVQAVVREKAWVDDETVDAFLAAGFEKEQILEVLVGVTQKTLSNYTNHIGETPLDDELSDFAWSAEELEAAAV